jgi:hypothetical protein
MARLILRLVGLFVLGFSGTSRAQQAVVVPNGGGAFTSFSFVAQTPTASQPGQVPPRDNQPPPPGTAMLRGRVYAGDSGQPLRKAQVRIFSSNPPVGGGVATPENRLATTDANGRFEFENVRAGRYTVSAQKAGYINMSFGQQRQSDPSKPIDVQDGLTIEKIDFSLLRGGVITGRILDEFGDPVADVQVAAMRSLFTGGARRLVNSGRPGMTNDIGEFRLSSLPPGDYYVSATYRSQIISPQQETNDRGGYAPSYYPGTADLSAAQRLTIAAAQTLSDITLALIPVRTSRVSGTAVDSQGLALKGVVLATLVDGPQLGGFFASPGPIRPDGAFALSGVAPGEYRLQVQGQGNNLPDAEYAVADVTVNGADINNVRIVSVKPSSVTGRVTFASGDPTALKPSTARIAVQPMAIGGITLGPFPPPVAARDDWSFQTTARAGMVRIALQGIPGGTWTVKAVRYRGTEITDTGLEVRPGEDVTDIELVVTDQISNVSGLVTNGRGDMVKDYWTVAFARDREKWASTRFFRMSRSDQDGRFKFVGLPAAEYFVIAVDTLDTSQANDPDFLARLETRAGRFSVGEGETKTLDLKLSAVP